MQILVRRLLDVVRRKGRCFQSGAFVLDFTGLEDWALGYISEGRPRPFQLTHNAYRKYRITQQVEFPIHIDACGAVKRVILAYIFRIGSKTYMYLKLERHPARSAGHVRNALATYVLHKRAQGPSRRESTKVSRANVALNARAFQSDNSYNTKYRVGNEMFIPARYVRYLVGS